MYQHIASISLVTNSAGETYYCVGFTFPPAGFPHHTRFDLKHEAIAYCRSNGWSIDIMGDAMFTEDEIERRVESVMNALDKRFMAGKMTQADYDWEVVSLDKWASQQYRAI